MYHKLFTVKNKRRKREKENQPPGGMTLNLRKSKSPEGILVHC